MPVAFSIYWVVRSHNRRHGADIQRKGSNLIPQNPICCKKKNQRCVLSKITTNYFQPPSPKYMYNSIFLYLALKYLHKNCFEKQSFGSEMCVRDSSKASIGSLTFKPSAHSNYHSGVYVSPPQNIKFVFDSTDPEYLYAFQVSVVYWGKNIAQS